MRLAGLLALLITGTAHGGAVKTVIVKTGQAPFKPVSAQYNFTTLSPTALTQNKPLTVLTPAQALKPLIKPEIHIPGIVSPKEARQQEPKTSAAQLTELADVIKGSEKDAQKHLDDFYDEEQSKLRGTWKGDAAGPDPIQGVVMSKKAAAQLENVSQLKPEQFRKLMLKLAKRPPKLRGAPNFPADYTFSFEFEFLVNRQMTEKRLQKVSKGKDAMTKKERARFEERKEVPSDRWRDAWKHVVSKVRSRMPKGWRIVTDSYDGPLNTLELNTGAGKAGYHRNTPQDWAELTAGLERVQKVLPGGLFTVHLHVGREAFRRFGKLAVDPTAFTRLVKVFESHWRVLSGRGYSEPAFTRTVTPYDFTDIVSGHGSDRHAKMINLSDRFPTMENKILTGLMHKNGKGALKFDPAKLGEAAWWTMALLRAAAHGSVPLASMGLPVPAGAKPTDAQLAAFLDNVYGSDVAGKALAMSRFAEADAQTPWLDVKETARALSRARSQYEGLGLGVIYDIHAGAGGYDRFWEERLREPVTRKKLLTELYQAGARSRHLKAYFPPDLFRELDREYNALITAEAEKTWWRRLLKWVRSLFGGGGLQHPQPQSA